MLALIVGIALSALPAAFVGLIIIAIIITLAVLIHPLAMLAVLLVLAPLRTLIQTEFSVRLPLDIGQLGVVALAAIWVIHAITRHKRLIPLCWTHAAWPLVIFCGVSISSLLITSSVSTTLNEIIKWLTMLVMALFMMFIAGTGRWRILVAALVAAGFANALVGIYIYLGGSGALHLLVNERFFRAFGTFGQPNPFGGFIGILLPLAFAGLADSLLQWYRSRRFLLACAGLLYLVALLTMLTALIMSWSRGAWLGVICAAIVIVFALPRRTLQSILAALAVIGCITAIWLTGILPASIGNRIASSTAEFFAFEDVRGVDITTENYAVVERLAHWQAALNMAAANPSGVGLGNYEIVYPQYRLLHWVFPLGHAHNFYLNILAELGIIGLIAYSIFLLSCLYYTWCGRQHPSPSVRCLSVGLLGSWTYLIVHSLLDNLYVNNVFLHIGVLIGLSYWVYHQTISSVQVEQYGYSDTY